MTHNPLDPRADPALGGPLGRPEPRDPQPRDMEPEVERDQDPARESYMGALAGEPSRDLSDEEEDAAKGDPGRQPRTYAPASERTPKPPAPGDREIIQQGMESDTGNPSSGSGADRSDPSEMR